MQWKIHLSETIEKPCHYTPTIAEFPVCRWLCKHSCSFQWSPNDNPPTVFVGRIWSCCNTWRILWGKAKKWKTRVVFFVSCAVGVENLDSFLSFWSFQQKFHNSSRRCLATRHIPGWMNGKYFRLGFGNYVQSFCTGGDDKTTTTKR